MKQNTPALDNVMLRDFGLITGSILAGLFGLFFPWLLEFNFPLWPWAIAITLFSFALIRPRLLRPVYRVWMAIGNVLGYINSRIILGLVFYFVVLPTGLLLRLFGKDPMSRSFSNQAASYRIHSKKPDRKQVERPF